MRRRVRRGLLRDILAGRSPARDLRIRLEEQGFSAASVLRLAVVEPAALRPSSAGALAGKTADRSTGGVLRALDAWLSQRRIPFLSLSNGPSVVVLTALPDAETAAARDLLDDLRAAAAAAAATPAARRRLLGAARRRRERAALPAAGARGVHGRPASRRSRAKARSSTSSAATSSCSTGSTRRRCPTSSSARSGRSSSTTPHTAPASTRRCTRSSRTTSPCSRPPTNCTSTATLCRSGLAHVEELLGIDLSELDDIVDVRLGLQAAVLLGRQPD